MKFVSPGQLDTNNPGTWPIYYKILCWIVIIGLAAFLYNKFLREPLVEQQDANKNKIISLKEKYKELFQYQQDLPKYKERSEELIGVLKSLLEYLPSKDEMPNLIDNVYVSAVDNNIVFDTFEPVTDIKNTYYDVKPIKLKADTNYANFSQFTGRISALQRILNVSDMKIDISKNDPNKLTIESQLQTYIYNQDLDALMKMDVSQLNKIGEETNVK